MYITTNSPANHYRNDYIHQYPSKLKTKPLYTLQFGTNRLTKPEQELIVSQLNEKMLGRPESVQKLYQFAVSFLNDKLTKEDFMHKMYNLLEEGFEELNNNESRYVINYGIAFDLHGPDTNFITDDSIIDSFESLLNNL